MLKLIKELFKPKKGHSKYEEQFVSERQLIYEVKMLTHAQRRALLRSVQKWLDALSLQESLFEQIGLRPRMKEAPHDLTEITAESLLRQVYGFYCEDDEPYVELTDQGILLFYPSGKTFRLTAEQINKEIDSSLRSE